jgi:CHAT domain-containing protein
LKAEPLIAEGLAKNPNDPDLLDEKAQADLLNGNYQSAIALLQRALEIRPDSPALLTDLGTAYFGSAESGGKPELYGTAFQSFSAALAKSPDDPVALFNRAIVGERNFLYTQAQDDWEHYLRLDSRGEWATEARRHLDDVNRKLAQRSKALAEPLLTPQQIVQLADRGAQFQNKLDERIEEYLKLATTRWFPGVFTDPAPQAQADKFALAALARVAQANHSDDWLADLIGAISNHSAQPAFAALADSLKADERGDYSHGRDAAHLAYQLFIKASNTAGELRAQAEEVYADHLLWEGDRCVSLLRDIDAPLQATRYSWIQAQMKLEASNCADLVGDMQTYHRALTEGTHLAEIHRYSALSLRGLGFQSLAATSLGDSSRGFSLAFSGLTSFWSGRDDLMKGYNLYTDLDAAADSVGLPYFKVAISREATALIDQHPDLLLRAMAHRWYGSAAYEAELPDQAAPEFAKASALFRSLPNTPATTRDRVDAEIWLARLEIRRGEIATAAARLKAAQPTLETLTGFNPAIEYYTAQAEIAMKQGEFASAEFAHRSSILLAEWALNTFSSDSDRQQWAEQSRDAYRNLVEWKLQMGDPDSALELWEWYRGAQYRAETVRPSGSTGFDATSPPDPKQAPPLPTPTVVVDQLALYRKETTVAYGAFQDGLAIWVFDNRGISSHWVPTPLPQLREESIRFRRLCSDPASDMATLQQSSRSLYNLLIAPIRNELIAGRTVLVEPDDFLSSLPWEALLDGKGQYLGKIAPIVVTPGLYQRMHLRTTRAITAETPALVASVPNARGFLPLPNAGEEAQAVASLFSSALVIRDNAVTRIAIRRGLPGKEMFYFAGHAIASGARNGLVLAQLDLSTSQSSLLTAEDLESADLTQLRLAVLSACDSDEEDQNKSYATVGLVQGFLKAGVPQVIASRWKVDSKQTEEFILLFYRNLLAGQDVAAAVQKAEAVQASDPTTAHPYYWAAFGLQGNN